MKVRSRLLERVLDPALLDTPWPFLAIGAGVALVAGRPALFPLLLIATLALGCAAAALRWPLGALCGVVVAQPFVQLVQAWLWTNAYVTETVAVRMGFAKEIVLAVAVIQIWRHRPRPLRTLDRIAVAFVGLFVLYALFPIGPELRIRYIAGRADVGFVLVFLVARWSPVSETIQRRFEAWLIAAASVIAALGIWNRLGPEGWEDWVDSTGVLDFRREVLDAQTLGAVERVAFGDGTVIRAGSLFFTANDLGYYLLVVIAIIGGRMLRRAARPWEPLVGVLCAVCIFYTFSRSAMVLVGLVGLVLAVSSGRLVRGAGAAAVTAVILVLLVGVLGVGSQIASGADRDDERTSSHVEALGDGVERIVKRPFGSGLGTASATAIRFDIEDLVQPENFYLKIGVEAGLLATALSVAFVLTAYRTLGRRTADDPRAVGPLAALAAVATGALVLETFSELAGSWTLWLLVGMALSVTGGWTAPSSPTRNTAVLR